MMNLNKILNKVLSVVLSLIVLIIPVMLPVSAVTYPDGIDQKTVEETIPKFDAILSVLLKDRDIKSAVYSAIHTDATVNSLFSGIYGLMVENADALRIMGVDISPKALSEAFKSYNIVSIKVASCSSLDEVLRISDSFVWGVNDRLSFNQAVYTILSPFYDILYMVLCSGTIEINDVISLTGGNGYQDVIVPILKILKAPDIISQDEYSRNAKLAKRSIINNLLNMIWRATDNILNEPVNNLCEILPALSAYLKNNELSSAINTLLAPLTINIGSLVSFNISGILKKVVDLENNTDLTALLNNIDLSSLSGDINLKLPQLSIDELAACAEKQGDTYIVKKGDAFLVILDFAIETLRLNQREIVKIAGEDFAKILEKLLQKSNQEIIALLFKILTGLNTSRIQTVTYSYPAHTPIPAPVIQGLTDENYQKVLDEIDPLFEQIIQENDPTATLESTVKSAVYSNSVVRTLTNELYKILSDESIASILPMLGITPSYWYPYFVDGDASGFRNALIYILKPYTPLLKFLLKEDSLDIMGILIGGSNGYDTVIIPLLENLTCSSESIKVYGDYGKSDDAVITDIIDPIIALIDEIAVSPIKVASAKLPHIIYFLNSGILSVMIENLLYPISSLINELELDDVINIKDQIKNDEFNIDVNALIKDSGLTDSLGIELPDIDVNNLAGYGTAISKQSKMTGQPTYTFIDGDSKAVVASILKILAQMMTSEDSMNKMMELMSGGEGGNEMFSSFGGNISSQFEGMSEDEMVVWLYNLFFKEKPKAEVTEKDAFIPTIIFEEPKQSPVKYIAITVAIIVFIIGFILLLKRLGYLERD
ncbi:MAG TPA: hypothetical protein GXZ23_02530 [Clostridiales bacterium]|nr:hypothetical protein [Clostridiales bacterium]